MKINLSLIMSSLLWVKVDNDYYKSQKMMHDALLQENTLQKHLAVMQILQIFLKKFCEFGPWKQGKVQF